MSRVVEIADFLNETQNAVVLDARSPMEFEQGHFPGSVNVPLLNDDVRKQVGIMYKSSGREAAVELGFKLVGPTFHELIAAAKTHAPGKEVWVYCWRGGMRSNILAWLLNMAGFQVNLLKGGYKVYRNWVLAQFLVPKKLVVLGGRTGSGKTDILKCLHEKGEQTIDLEALASHRGSAFGALGLKPQPTHQQFENELAMKWSQLDGDRITWIENESRQVGTKIIPAVIYAVMRSTQVMEMDVPQIVRRKRILDEYGVFPNEALAEITEKLYKRMGREKVKEAVLFLAENDKDAWVNIVLNYYDEMYDYGTSQREPSSIFKVVTTSGDPKVNADLVYDAYKKFEQKLT